MADTVKGVEIDPVREKLIERFAERLKEAYPQSDKNNPDPMICYGDFCDIVDEVAAEITDSIANGVTVQEPARPLEEWWEAYGDVLWWKFPIEEPPYVGSPLDENWPGYHTHWTPIPLPQPPKGE